MFMVYYFPTVFTPKAQNVRFLAGLLRKLLLLGFQWQATFFFFVVRAVIESKIQVDLRENISCISTFFKSPNTSFLFSLVDIFVFYCVSNPLQLLGPRQNKAQQIYFPCNVAGCLRGIKKS